MSKLDDYPGGKTRIHQWIGRQKIGTGVSWPLVDPDCLYLGQMEQLGFAPRVSHSLVGQPWHPLMETAETQTAMEVRKLFLRPLLESHVLICHWLKQITWMKSESKGGEIGSTSYGGRPKATWQRTWIQEGLENGKMGLCQGLATLHCQPGTRDNRS